MILVHTGVRTRSEYDIDSDRRSSARQQPDLEPDKELGDGGSRRGRCSGGIRGKDISGFWPT